MAKVFRLHKGNNTIQDWQNSPAYGAFVIGQIQDPNGANASKEITSIPSPFARIDLVKTAFREVADLGNLAGNTIYHKMVSDSLDVGEIFFNYGKLQDKIQIIIWDRANDLNALLNSPSREHKMLGKTLNLFLKQDAQAYNFANLNDIYLLNYIGPGGPKQMNIIGATSPVTLFFSSANNLNFVSQNIAFGKDMPFDGKYQPLYARDIAYQEYLYALQAGVQGFSATFPELDNYLKLNFSQLNNSQKAIINAIDGNTISKYPAITIGNNTLNVLGCHICQKPNASVIQSDFEIQPTIANQSNPPLPLVLPIAAGNKYTGHMYVTANWGKDFQAPYFDHNPLSQRTLPVDGTKYPYLTVSDFLEDSVVCMPYDMNTANFFDGNLVKSKADNSNSYLLPLTDLFFQYFTVNDLLNKQVGGKKMIEMKENAGGLSVTLRIPIRKGYIEYDRLYFKNSQPDLAQNNGAVEDNVELGLGLSPGIKFSVGDNAIYRIALANKHGSNISLSCGNGAAQIQPDATVVRRENEDDLADVTSYVVDKPIDRIKISLGNASGVVIPKLCSRAGQSQFTFAVDFGTTNTHIEYGVDGNVPRAFDIDINDVQMRRLHLNYKADLDIQYCFEDYFIPDEIGGKSNYNLPLRTVYAEKDTIDYVQPVHMLASGNIPFRYGKSSVAKQVNIKTNLKWDVKSQDRVRLYLENLYFMMRNKVLSNGGALSKTQIVWFYPASMTAAHINKFKGIWDGLYTQYFAGPTANVMAMSESVAPYNYYDQKKGAKQNVLTIDIGGETTDVYVVEARQPKILSSFRFASNALFGDGYNWDANNNGFVNEFYNDFQNCLSKNNLDELALAFSAIEKTKKSADIIAFLFGLSENREIQELGTTSLDFTQKLSDNERLKYPFIIFYAAILYYVANLMKAKKLEMPLTIAFSGNGSKSLKVLSSDNGTLAKFIKLIFESVYEKKYPAANDLDVIYDANPKEATCKGGILKPNPQAPDTLNNLKCSLVGCDMSTLSGTMTYEGIDKAIEESVVQQVNEFLDFLFRLNETNNNFFMNNFQAAPALTQFVKETCRKNLMEYLGSGLMQKRDEIEALGETVKIEETMFFYPLIGMLNNLAREIVNKPQDK